MPTKAYYREQAERAEARARNYESKGMTERAEYFKGRAEELRNKEKDAEE